MFVCVCAHIADNLTEIIKILVKVLVYWFFIRYRYCQATVKRCQALLSHKKLQLKININRFFMLTINF